MINSIPGLGNPGLVSSEDYICARGAHINQCLIDNVKELLHHVQSGTCVIMCTTSQQRKSQPMGIVGVIDSGYPASSLTITTLAYTSPYIASCLVGCWLSDPL